MLGEEDSFVDCIEAVDYVEVVGCVEVVDCKFQVPAVVKKRIREVELVAAC